MSSGRGDFFAVDRGAWNIAVARGLNPAIAFLVLARGSAGDNQTTSWSIHSVEKYTGISRPRAVAAIENLLDSGILRMLDAGEITSRIAAGIIRRAPRRGCPAYNIGPDRGQEGGGAALIWLPNALVDGVKSAPVPPLELIRQTQNVGALKALIALYAAHDLKNCGGVSWRAIRRTFTRERVAESRGFVVWCFKGTPEATVFWNRAPSVEFMTGTKIGGCDTYLTLAWRRSWLIWLTLIPMRARSSCRSTPSMAKTESANLRLRRGMPRPDFWAPTAKPSPTGMGEFLARFDRTSPRSRLSACSGFCIGQRIL
jgi:hypothetical protein